MAREYGPGPEMGTFRSAERKSDVPKRLQQLHEVEKHFLTRGVFFDVYTMELPNDQGEDESFVFKDLRSGDVLMSPEDQVALFQHQYYEWASLNARLGTELFPESYWIRSTDFSDDEAHGFYAVPGKTANTMQMFITIQLDRQLSDRYSSDDKKKGALKTLMSQVGETLAPAHEEKPFIGAIVQKRVNGVSFAEYLKQLDKSHPQYATLRDNTKKLINGLREYQLSNPYGAFTWHGLGSDNVMVEVDEQGQITGRVCVVDANFTERPNKIFKNAVVAKLEQNVLHPLEKAFDLE